MALGSILLQPSDEFKAKVEKAIWGHSDNTNGGAATSDSLPLDCFCKHFQSEVREPALDAVLSTMAILKTNVDKPRRDLHNLVSNPAFIDLSLRLMLMTGCSSRAMGGAVFRRKWMDHETLTQYLTRILPQNTTNGQINSSQALSLDKLTADYLKRYANVEVAWTNHVTDHLLLLKGSDWKKVYVFAHPAFLLRSIEALSHARDNVAPNGNTETTNGSNPFAKSLPRGCLPLPLLRETLLTLEILFPPVGNPGSQRLLAADVQNEGLDPMLLRTVQFHASTFDDVDDVQELTDVHSLYDQFPFWGARLQILWQEAEEPTPTSFIGKLSDRKKSPRFMWWCGLMAIAVAIMFGIVGTVLAALQVWISYCSWMDDANVFGCGLKGGHSDSTGNPLSPQT
ncbi:hypothetical protein QBC43DRAFT_208455 [Cladorrhinum sp. PSN259]|nr:hypothetical protein QBC43DRAFT_208455 [Cladorrhinum sp. PSN259]